MKYCKNCQCILEDEAKFCPKCGVSQVINQMLPTAKSNKKSKYTKSIISITIVAILVIGIFIFAIINLNSTSVLKSNGNAIDIVRSGEFSNYPGKPIGETFDKIIGENVTNYNAEWSDITNDTLGENMFEIIKQDGYNRVVRTAITCEEGQITFIWAVNTENGKFDLYFLNDGSQLYDSTDSSVISFLQDIFG